jgi:hypothetical protein
MDDKFSSEEYLSTTMARMQSVPKTIKRCSGIREEKGGGNVGNRP